MHTPTPWQLMHRDNPNSDEFRYWLMGRHPGYGNARIAEVILHGDAAFIVQACNAHDALVAACSNVMQRLDWAVGYQALDSRLSPQQMLELADTLRAALALVTPQEAVR